MPTTSSETGSLQSPYSEHAHRVRVGAVNRSTSDGGDDRLEKNVEESIDEVKLQRRGNNIVPAGESRLI